MSPGYGMFQQQSAKLQITPQFRQALKILQLTTPELLEYIQQEMQDNPMLESVNSNWGSQQRDYDPILQATSKGISLEKHLMGQLNVLVGIANSVLRTATYMIGNLDDKGYLEPTLVEIVDALKVEEDVVMQALRLVQSLEPPGVGARDLKECLAIQAARLPTCPTLVYVLIQDHLEDIASLSISRLSLKLKIASDELQESLELLKKLNPYPGAAFTTTEIPYIVPDVMIEWSGEEWSVTIPDRVAPRLTVNGYYDRILKDSGVHAETRAFLQKKLTAATFFIRCLEQRRETLYRVTRAIVEEQIDFFIEGVHRLRPLNLHHIADKIGMHESTISRVTVGKFAQTPWGVFELKSFFPSGYNLDSGDSTSAGSVKTLIKEIITNEDKKKPFSDQQLAEQLSQEGISISRRTVAKYREEMGIFSSVNRKQI